MDILANLVMALANDGRLKLCSRLGLGVFRGKGQGCQKCLSPEDCVAEHRVADREIYRACEDSHERGR